MNQTFKFDTTLSEKMASYKGIKKICEICGSKRNYRNPMAKCYECKKNFCFDHITAGNVNNKMLKGDEVRDVCEADVKKFNYYSILDLW